MENQEILTKFEELEKQIASQTKNKSVSYESESLDLLFSALGKAQGEIEIAKTDSCNPFFKSKYADLSQIVKASRPYLAKNGLSVIQRVLTNGNKEMYLLTRLCHASGQWIESKMPITPMKPDIQSIGSYITYLRRYNWSAIVGVAASEEDDDGEGAMQRDKKTEYLSMKEIKELETLLDKLPKSEKENLLNWCQAKDIHLIVKSKFTAAKMALEAKLKKEK